MPLLVLAAADWKGRSPSQPQPSVLRIWNHQLLDLEAMGSILGKTVSWSQEQSVNKLERIIFTRNCGNSLTECSVSYFQLRGLRSLPEVIAGLACVWERTPPREDRLHLHFGHKLPSGQTPTPVTEDVGGSCRNLYCSVSIISA